jgi:radical SAM superfamily enzyme
MEEDTEAKFLVEKAAQINEQLKPIENQLTDVKSSSFFPYFGLGSQAAGIDSKLSVLRSEYNTTLQNIRLLNLQVESDPE